MSLFLQKKTNVSLSCFKKIKSLFIKKNNQQMSKLFEVYIYDRQNVIR